MAKNATTKKATAKKATPASKVSEKKATPAAKATPAPKEVETPAVTGSTEKVAKEIKEIKSPANILSATYGTDTAHIDVTEKMKNLNGRVYKVSNKLFDNDPAAGLEKVLTLTIEGRKTPVVIKEGTLIKTIA